MARQSNHKVIPGCEKILEQWKYEIAAEMGLPVGANASSLAGMDTEFATELGGLLNHSNSSKYWGHIASRDTGAVGGAITSRLIEQAQKTLLNMQ